MRTNATAYYFYGMVDGLIDNDHAKSHHFTILSEDQIVVGQTSHITVIQTPPTQNEYKLFDLIHLFDTKYVPRHHVCPIILSLFEPVTTSKNRLFGANQSFKRFAKVIVPTRICAKNLVEQRLVSANFVAVVSPSVWSADEIDNHLKLRDNAELLSQFKDQHLVNNSYLLCANSLDWPVVCQAFASLYARNRALRLILICSDQTEEQLVKQQIIQMHLTSVVVISNVDIDLFMMLHRYATAILVSETSWCYSPSACAAMALEKTMVVANEPMLLELCGEAALYYYRHDPVDLCDKIGDIQHKVSVQEMLKLACQKQATEMSGQKMVEQLIEIYQKLKG